MYFNKEPDQVGYSYTWDEVTESDTPESVLVDGGQYVVSVEGSFGGASIEVKYGTEEGEEASVDSNLTFTENKSYGLKIGRGFVLPVITGGTSTSVKIKLTPIPR